MEKLDIVLIMSLKSLKLSLASLSLEAWEFFQHKAFNTRMYQSHKVKYYSMNTGN